MNYQIEKPHLIFLLVIPIILLIGFLSGDATLVINVHYTYYVFKYIHLTMLISILFGIIGIGYWIMEKANKRISK
ncbi:MAG: cytochrome c oxidase subunit 1 [Saprospiraceae bacterium]|jgi:heme/copper-type cytochrome/quinol oxidase subunit 1